jgi:hypothetical protein
LAEVAAAHGNLRERSRHLDKFPLGGVVTKDLLRSVHTPDLLPAGSDLGESAYD